jgi:hypothetical protein
VRLLDDLDDPDGLKQPLDERRVRLARVRAEAHGRCALQNLGRGVGHDPDDAPRGALAAEELGAEEKKEGREIGKEGVG